MVTTPFVRQIEVITGAGIDVTVRALAVMFAVNPTGCVSV